MADCVRAAYQHYVARNGRLPGPMREDYAVVIRERQAHVARAGDDLVGVLVLDRTDEGFLLENIAVRPGLQKTGVGRALLTLAEQEARRQGHDSIHLYTQDVMTENQALYARIGYVEYARRFEEGLNRVYMRKAL